ncbi:MAG: hypothetical protein C4289_14475, partial [Chloroflexota bacterium]
KAANVPYRLSSGGTTVSVPNERVTELRLQMASAGVLTGGRVGFDLFDKSSFGATDFAQRVNYQRALEGELSRPYRELGRGLRAAAGERARQDCPAQPRCRPPCPGPHHALQYSFSAPEGYRGVLTFVDRALKP